METATPARGFDGPRSMIDPWSADVLRDPSESYAELRRLGPAVWLDRYDMVALPRFAEAKAALADWQTFSSASGVGVDEETNAATPPGALESDPPQHTEARRRSSAGLTPGRVDAETGRIRDIAESVVKPLVGRSDVEVIGELAGPYIAAVIGGLLGLSHDATADLPAMAARAFNMFGPAGEIQRDGFQAFESIVAHAIEQASAASGEEPAFEQIEQLGTFMFPGVDTTVQAIGTTLYLLARHPDQWTLLREDPSRVTAAVAEALRLHSPVRHFTRSTTRAVDIGGTAVPAATRVLIMYGSANRDERRFPDPDRYDMTRTVHSHVAFGHGIHRCPGAGLATREITTLLEAILARVDHLELQGPPTWGSNLTIHGLQSAHISFIP